MFIEHSETFGIVARSGGLHILLRCSSHRNEAVHAKKSGSQTNGCIEILMISSNDPGFASPTSSRIPPAGPLQK